MTGRQGWRTTGSGTMIQRQAHIYRKTQLDWQAATYPYMDMLKIPIV